MSKEEKKDIKYEDAVKRLEEIVNTLEKNDVPLDEALSLFEEGTKLSRECVTMLNNAKIKITQAQKDEK